MRDLTVASLRELKTKIEQRLQTDDTLSKDQKRDFREQLKRVDKELSQRWDVI